MAIKTLPITRIIFYKHGIGFFERRGKTSGEKNFKLNFKKKDMNDILKSLIVRDGNASGKVISISFDTQEDVEQLIRDKTINLGRDSNLRDILTFLRGYDISFNIKGEEIKGTIIGIDYSDNRQNFCHNLLVISVSESNSITTFPLSDIKSFRINDEQALGDIKFFLEKSMAEKKKDERTITILLDDEDHDLIVNYIAPTPAWKLSYRMIYEKEKNKASLIGWSIVNNTMDEDLDNVSFVFTTGMPVSFVYDLYTPKILSRPQLKDEMKKVSSVNQETSLLQKKDKVSSMPGKITSKAMAELEFDEVCCHEDVEEEGKVEHVPEKTVTGERYSEVVKYVVPEPVTIKRGQSVMVPIINISLDCVKEYIYTSKKGEKNPYVYLTLKNTGPFALDRGPVTIMEDDLYIGEALLTTVSKGQAVKLPYAVGMDISVKEEVSNYDSLNSIVFIENNPGNYLFYKEVYHIIESLYTANSSNDDNISLVIEHKPYDYGYELFDTPEPIEKTDNYVRWKIDLPSRTFQTFKVKERKKVYRSEYYNNLTIDKLSRWFKCRYLDENNHNILSDIFVNFEQMREFDKWKENLETERKQLLEKQKFYREQLQALGDKGDEGNLRKRYIKNIETNEDRIEEILKEKDNLGKKFGDLKKKIDKSIADLAKEYKQKKEKVSSEQ